MGVAGDVSAPAWSGQHVWPPLGCGAAVTAAGCGCGLPHHPCCARGCVSSRREGRGFHKGCRSAPVSMPQRYVRPRREGWGLENLELREAFCQSLYTSVPPATSSASHAEGCSEMIVAALPYSQGCPGDPADSDVSNLTVLGEVAAPLGNLGQGRLVGCSEHHHGK